MMVRKSQITNHKSQVKHGFTLIETIVTISIFVLMMGAVSWAIISFYRANGYIVQQSFAVNSARIGVETMVREIREATYSDIGTYPVVSASTTEFVFYSDVDRDNSIERIRYFLDGSNFKKGEIEASGDPLVYNEEDEQVNILSEYVRNTGAQQAFTFFDSTGAEVVNLNEIADIVLVRVNLIVNVVEGRAPEEFTLRSNAQLRNLKTNL